MVADADPEFEKATELARWYLQEGLSRELEDYLSGEISLQTARHYAKGNGAKLRHTPRMNFIRAMASVPSREKLAPVRLYRSMLEHIGSSRDEQLALAKYSRTYKFEFPETNAALKVNLRKIVITHDAKLSYTYFWTRYKVNNKLQYPCDGIVIIRGNKIWLIGIHVNTTLLGHIESEAFPDRVPLYGTMKFECITEGIFCETAFCAVPTFMPSPEEKERQLERARTRLNRTGE